MSGNEVLHRIQQGDKAAFEQLFTEKFSVLCAYANHFVNDLDASQDIVQDVLFHLWEIKEQLPIDIPPRALLFKSVQNKCLNHIKHKKVEEKYSESVLNQPQNIMYEQHISESTTLHEVLRKGIDMLPPERKKIFIMQRYDELSYKEIAERLDISVKTVENQIGKALQFLRNYMQSHLPTSMLMIGLLLVKFFSFIIGVFNTSNCS